jgi:GrpB-like predicted nucleotidyltransferase (UPF0157 family)
MTLNGRFYLNKKATLFLERHTNRPYPSSGGSDNPVLARPLQFRDYLRKHPEAAAEYAALKKELAKKYIQDIESYVDGKTAFVEVANYGGPTIP